MIIQGHPYNTYPVEPNKVYKKTSTFKKDIKVLKEKVGRQSLNDLYNGKHLDSIKMQETTTR